MQDAGSNLQHKWYVYGLAAEAAAGSGYGRRKHAAELHGICICCRKQVPKGFFLPN